MIPLTQSYSDPALREAFLKTVRRYRPGSQQYIGKFIKQFGRLYRTPYGICVNSGTNALVMALWGVGVRQGDQVLLPAYTCKAVLDTVALLGGLPTFVDNYVDYEHGNFNLDEKDLLKKMRREVKAVILPYMFGGVRRYHTLETLDVPVIEDVTLSLGAPLEDSFSKRRIVVSSFHSSKMISTIEGGIIATNDKRLYEHIAQANNLSDRNRKERLQKQGSIHYELDFSFRPSELHFIWGYLQLRHLPEFISERQRIARIYIDALDPERYELPIFDKTNVYFRFIAGVRQGSVARLLKHLQRCGIEGGRGVYPLLSSYWKTDVSLPHAESAISRSISVPLYPGMKNGETRAIISAMNTYKP